MSNRPKVQKSRSGSRPTGPHAKEGSNPLLKWLIVGVVALVAVAVGVAFLAAGMLSSGHRTLVWPRSPM